MPAPDEKTNTDPSLPRMLENKEELSDRVLDAIHILD
jgi:hypothetical protein